VHDDDLSKGPVHRRRRVEGHPFAEVVAISHAARAGEVGPARFDGDAFTHPARRDVATDRLDLTGCLVTEHEGLLQNVAADPPVLEVVHV